MVQENVLCIVNTIKMPNKAKGKSSAQYYKSNPESKSKKETYDKKFQKDPKVVKKRVELITESRKRGTYGKHKAMGKDMAHTSKGLVMKSASKNRGSKSDMPGDKKARGKKK